MDPVIQHLVISWVGGEAYMSGPPKLTIQQYQEALAAINRYQPPAMEPAEMPAGEPAGEPASPPVGVAG